MRRKIVRKDKKTGKRKFTNKRGQTHGFGKGIAELRNNAGRGRIKPASVGRLTSNSSEGRSNAGRSTDSSKFCSSDGDSSSKFDGHVSGKMYSAGAPPKSAGSGRHSDSEPIAAPRGSATNYSAASSASGRFWLISAAGSSASG